MKYDNLRAFEKHVEGATPKHFSSVYLLMGKEVFECREAANTLIHAILPHEKEREFSLCLFEGEHASSELILNEIHSISFLTPWKVIWVQQAEKLKKGLLERLEKELDHLPPHHYLIFSASTFPKTSSFYKKAEKAGVVLDLPDLKSWEKEKKLTEWVAKQASSARKLISYPACQLLVKQTGANQLLLQQELDKLLCYIGDKKEVSLQDIYAICTSLPVESIWQLGEAIFQGETASALRISTALLQGGTAFLPLLRQIRSQFQTEYQICTLLHQGAPPTAITQEYPYMKGQILERHLQLAKQYGKERFKKGLLVIDAIEIQVKNSQIAEELLTELLMIKLTQVE